ncbi:guanine nucleotide exchange protein smcr8a isoform X1 [Salmo trutta]|uniref:Smith-Magenis syndrome chromosome region, candidate 8a n=1 Tax=Salmo trutta TaxID=8032 RepID=A0A674E546_SALTR|nr:guanine nucleotide exchange protein smcr8a-like isoform X1 [Salmo trutta]
MIGAPDVVAFTKEDDFGEVGYPDPWVMPEEFSVPLFPSNNNANPWTKTSYAKFTKDFILISEFSEQVGPQPLLTIPDDPKVFGTFDLNYFSLRIMSVDYQASFVGHPTGSGYPRLSFVEDSRVVLGDSKEGAFAYVHHLTLYDLEARGFVRPFCMAYVSADERKIMQQFQELSLRFSRASECLKTGNRRAFARELQRKLRDLEYTRSVLQKEEGLQREAGPQGCYSAHAVDKANELAAMEKSIFEHRDLLRQITSYPLHPRRDAHAAHCQHCVTESRRHGDAPPGPDRDPGEEAGERRQSYTPQLIKGKSAKCFAKRLKNLTELCEERFYDATVELLTHTERCFRGDLCYLYTRRLDRALRRKQNVVNFLFEEELGEEEEEVAALGRIFCSLNHTMGTDQHSHIHTPSIVLCPEPPESADVPEVYPPCPDNSAPQSDALTGDERLESSLSDLTMETQDQESSEENKDSFSSDRSGGEEEEEEGGRDQTPVFLLEAEEDTLPASGLQPGSLPLPLVVNQEPQAMLPVQGVYGLGSPHCQSPGAGLDLPVSSLGDTTSKGSDQDGSDCTTSASTGSERAGSPLGYGGVVTLRQKKRAGQGALRFVRQYPFALHALWSLLSGRTLVVLGSEEGRVRRLVSALALYVPGPGRCGERVQPWLSCPFSLTDLQRWKLIGLQRMASPVGTSMLCSLSRYSRYISVLDADRKTLRCPGYRGTLLSNMADHRTQLRRGSTYFLHLQNVLSRLAARAFLLSFTHHLHLPISHREQRQEVEERTRGFLRDQLRLGEDDCSVLMYLSQLITRHYLETYNPPGTTRQDLEANNILDPTTGGAITPEQNLDPTTGGVITPQTGIDPTTGGAITPETGLDPTTGGAVTPETGLDPTTGGVITPEQNLDPTTGGAITPETGLDPTTGGVITPETGLDPTTGGVITPETGLDPTTGGVITLETGLDPTTGGAVTPETGLDPTTGGVITPEQNLDPTTGGAITPETGLDPTTGGVITPETGLDPTTGGVITPETGVDPTTGGAVTPEQNLDPTTGGAITPETGLDPTTGGAITPETGLDPTTGGVITPETGLDPTTGGVITPETGIDPTTGGVITPETGLDPTTGGATRKRAPPSFTFNYTTSLLYKI